MATTVCVAFLIVLVVGISVTLWVAWPTLQAVRERQRVEYEARQGLLRVQQATYSAMDRLLREARTSSSQPQTFIRRPNDDQ
jgi:hypothetical protein